MENTILQNKSIFTTVKYVLKYVSLLTFVFEVYKKVPTSMTTKLVYLQNKIWVLKNAENGTDLQIVDKGLRNASKKVVPK